MGQERLWQQQIMTSRLFQVPLSMSELNTFRTPESQPPTNPRNCGAVSGLLLGLVTPKKANEMTELRQGVYIHQWATYVSAILEKTVTDSMKDISTFKTYFKKNLFDGFATLVLTIPKEGQFGHYFVVAKLDGDRLVILDPQIRTGYYESDNYPLPKPPLGKFSVLLRDTPQTPSVHTSDSVNFLAAALESCTISNGEVEMEVDPPPRDVEMTAGRRRKRRKTKRRSLAKRTLRRMNRRR
jgi:hypothetical protein